MRDRLREAGVVLAVAPLMGFLATHAGPAASPQLLASLGKIAIAGIGSGATGQAVGGFGVSSIKLTTWGQAPGTVTIPVVVQILAGGWLGFVTALTFLVYVAWRRPKWFMEFRCAFGGQGFREEFFPLQRWTWTTPPLHCAGRSSSHSSRVCCWGAWRLPCASCLGAVHVSPWLQ